MKRLLPILGIVTVLLLMAAPHLPPQTTPAITTARRSHRCITASCILRHGSHHQQRCG